MNKKKIKSIDDFLKTYFPKEYEKNYYESLSLKEKAKYDVQKILNRSGIIVSKG